jgi:RHS repeat-associated protein
MGLSYFWNKNELRSINNIQFYNGFDQKFIGACSVNASSLTNCLIKLSEDEYVYGGNYYRRIKLGGVTVAVLINDTIYPAITDPNDALIGLVSANGSAIEFTRSFNDFGVKLSATGNKELEKAVPFSFGNLIQIPSLNGLVLQSKTRVYIPKINQWASVDTAAVWNPELLLKHAGNWNALEYASGDPVNKIDAKGTWSELNEMVSMPGVRQELEVYKVAGLAAVDGYKTFAVGGKY